MRNLTAVLVALALAALCVLAAALAGCAPHEPPPAAPLCRDWLPVARVAGAAEATSERIAQAHALRLRLDDTSLAGAVLICVKTNAPADGWPDDPPEVFGPRAADLCADWIALCRAGVPDGGVR